MFSLQPGEELREIDGFPGYWASNFGRIISNKVPNRWIVLKGSLNSDGYPGVSLYRDGERRNVKIMDLVGKAFNDFSGEGNQWRHSPDSDKNNNRADNLVWGTDSENKWDWIVSKNLQEDWGISFEKRSKKNPWQLRMSLIPGESLKHVGNFPTVESAREERDRLCAE